MNKNIGTLGLVGALLFAAFALFYWLPRPAHLPDLKEAKALFAISASPSPSLLEVLERAHKEGIRVRLITSQNIVGSYSIHRVPREKITQNGILIDNVSWHPLP